MDLRYTWPLFYGVVLATCILEVGSLQCYECVDMEDLPESTVDCDNPGKELLLECLEGTTQCLTFEGVMTRPNGESQRGVARLCGPPPQAFLNDTARVPDNKCYCDEDAAFWLEELVPVIAPDDLTVEGGICFCGEKGCNYHNSTEDACRRDDEVDDDGNNTGHERALLWLVVMCVSLAGYLD
ncbi:uncharacterized protein LOC110983477 [Acanthaster planci]|uniref:Uncharacterized protein LOC110983477 n=1 Tax=Acanthaster planci TaxID=133434 RepID=A0A8B7YYN7_ACAPL|nr:uncharacterized protein LOC110983477 [Acanthaster planci]